jgi:hypothetical protein
MRTKTLLAAAAILAAGLASSMAQSSNVYSLNVVGYYNLNLTNGFNLIANQLDKDGTGTNNTLATVLGTNLPVTTRVYTFDPVAGAYNFATLLGGNWSGANLAAVNRGLQPGQGVFVQIPASATLPQTVTVVGEVRQGTLATPVGAFYQILASQVPQVVGIQSDLGFAPVATDRVFQWLPVAQAYGSPKTFAAGNWIGGQPTNSVGEAVFVQGHAGSAWTRSFTVQ